MIFIMRLRRVELLIIQSNQRALSIQSALTIGIILIFANRDAGHGILSSFSVHFKWWVKFLSFYDVLYLVEEYLLIYCLFLFRLRRSMFNMHMPLWIMKPLHLRLVLIQRLHQLRFLSHLLVAFPAHFVAEQVQVVLHAVSFFYGYLCFFCYLTQLVLEVDLLCFNSTAYLIDFIMNGAFQIMPNVCYEFGPGHP